MLQPLGPVRLMLHQGEAEGVEGLALIGLAAHPAQRPRRRAEAAEPVEEERLPAQGLLLLARQRQGRIQQPLVRRLAQALHAQPVQEGRPKMADVGRAERVQRRRQRFRLGDQLQAPGQLGQVPEHRLGLPREGVEAVLVEIGGGEAWLIVRQEAPRAVVEALARDVQIVGVQHPVHEARRDPLRRQRRRGLDHRPQEARRVAWRDRRMIQAAGVLHQHLDLILAPIVGGALERPEPDVAVRQPHHDGRSCRRRLVMSLKVFARLDQRQDAAGRHAQAVQHGRRQRLARPALQRQPPVGMTRPRRLARAFGAQVEKAGFFCFPNASLAEGGCLRDFPHLRRQEAAPVADVGVVNAELMAVIAHGHGAGLAGQGLEPAEMGDPFRVAQRL